MTAYERSGWRDESISARHRRWGYDCPAVDLDFLVCEYHLGVPVAIVEYKHHLNREGDEVNLAHPTYRALARLGDVELGTPLPFLMARYWPEAWAFRVRAINDEARRHLDTDGWVDMTERQFVARLYRMRNLKVADVVLRNCQQILPRDAHRTARDRYAS